MGQTSHRDSEISVVLAEIQAKGTSNFAGPGGVSVVHNKNWATYIPSIIPTVDPSGAVGDVWITDIAANSFVVRNSGSAITEFTYIINRT